MICSKIIEGVSAFAEILFSKSFNPRLCTVKHYSEIITINPNIRFGKPCIGGTRITVYDTLVWYASGMTASEILDDYPELTDEELKAALAYAAKR